MLVLIPGCMSTIARLGAAEQSFFLSICSLSGDLAQRRAGIPKKKKKTAIWKRKEKLSWTAIRGGTGMLGTIFPCDASMASLPWRHGTFDGPKYSSTG